MRSPIHVPVALTLYIYTRKKEIMLVYVDETWNKWHSERRVGGGSIYSLKHKCINLMIKRTISRFNSVKNLDEASAQIMQKRYLEVNI